MRFSIPRPLFVMLIAAFVPMVLAACTGVADEPVADTTGSATVTGDIDVTALDVEMHFAEG